MNINKELVKIFLCPYCKGDIAWDEKEEILYCKICERKYPIINGIFKMFLNDEGSD